MSAVTGAPRGVRAKRVGPWLLRQDWFFALALALFVGCSVWFGRAIQDFLAPSAKSITTPTFVGLTFSDALLTAQRTHLKVTVLQRTPSDRFPKDVVMRQDPVAGSLVREGRQISVVVSQGVVIFPMPDLRYESMREVGLDLSRYKLALGKIKTVPSDSVPNNRVVNQDPAPLTAVRAGTTVNLELARGGPPSLKVPNFTSMPIDEARAYAAENHITIGEVVWTPFGRYGPPRGVVVNQRPSTGSPIDESQEVSLQVSAGPDVSGYIVRQAHALVVVPEDTTVVDQEVAGDKPGLPTVRVEMRDETGTYDLFNGFAQPKQKLEFNVTAIGTSELDVYVNNELIDSTRLGIEPSAAAPPRRKGGR